VIFLRCDTDKTPDEASYNYAYGYSSWFSKEDAIRDLYRSYGKVIKEFNLTEDQIRNAIVKTKKGWSLPLSKGALYGLDIHNEMGISGFFKNRIMDSRRKFLQIFEGEPMWRSQTLALQADGDPFVPTKLILSFEKDIFMGYSVFIFKKWITECRQNGWYEPTISDLAIMNRQVADFTELKNYLLEASLGDISKVKLLI